jgi:hypothetical protein
MGKSKKERLILSYKMILGIVDIDDYADKIPKDKINEIKEIQKYITDIGLQEKEAVLKVMEISIETLEKEKGDDYSESELQQRFIGLMLMTDPNNKIAPFELNKQNKN